MKTRHIRNAVFSRAIALGLLAAAATFSAAAQSPAAEGRIALRDQSNTTLRAAAEQGLRTMMSELARGQAANARVPADFPIAVATFGELRKVSLGAGFEVSTIDPAPLMFAKQTADLSRMTRGTDTWKFMLLSGGRPVGLLDMNKVQGRWQAIGAGSSKLAEDLAASAPATGAGAFRFVRIYQATSDLIEVRGADNIAHYVPLRSARRSLSLSDAAAKSATLTSEELLPSLQSAVQGNLQRGRQ